MLELISLPISSRTLLDYGGSQGLERAVEALGCDGLELIWAGEDLPGSLPCAEKLGYHMLFYPDWLDFWRGDKRALCRKFGSARAWRDFYGGDDGTCLLAQFTEDLDRAVAVGARYVVFHVSDVSIEEGYTYRWEHSDEEVIDAMAEFINCLTAGRTLPFELLVENQWWPGFRFTEPALTERLLARIDAPKKGIMLDIGHLMNTEPMLDSEARGAAYVRSLLEKHGALAASVHGVHLHQSLSGAYVRANAGSLPEGLSADYLTRYAESYAHILKIDRHRPWTDPAIGPVLETIAPRYLTHELSAPDRAALAAAVTQQRETLHAAQNGRLYGGTD